MNIRAGKLRNALDQIRLNSGCNWSRSMAVKAIAEDNIIINNPPDGLVEGQCGTEGCGAPILYKDDGPIVHCVKHG